MAVIKCKMCGGDILLSEDKTYGVCDSCGSSQTMPRVPDEQRANLFNRANHFRRANEFDKAVSAYEKILDADNTDAEAHWGAVISRFGIEYVEDPVSHEYIPTCHRAQLNPILTDADYLAAVENAPDGYTRGLYEQEAKRISEIQKGILAVSQREEPYDVFICYKETTDGGTRTKDSTIAQEIYFQLTNAGYKVFFSRITLEHKLGTQYEPYIFAALNSARVMLVIGTQPEYFSAVWVRNEWSRYLALMREDPSRLLIPCYRDMDPYDLPEELSAFQSQDMSKIGFMQDLLYGVRKVLDAGKAETRPAASAPAAVSGDIAPLLKRAFMFLEDGEWTSADEYAERVLDKDPENGTAYLAKLMAELRVNKREGLKDQPQPFDDMGHFKKAARFGDAAMKRELEDANRYIRQRNENARLEGIYAAAERAMCGSVSEQQFKAAAASYHQILSYKDSESKEKQCLARAEECRKDVIYADAVGLFNNAGRNRPRYTKAAEMFKKIPGYKDADEYVLKCEQKSQQIIREEQEAELERKRAEEQRRIAAEKRAKKTKKLAAIIIPAVAVITAVVILFTTVIIPGGKYSDAVALQQAGKYEEAIAAFEALGDYKDCEEQIKETKYLKGISLSEKKDYAGAAKIFVAICGYKDADTILQEEEYIDVLGMLMSDENTAKVPGDASVFGNKKYKRGDIKQIVFEKSYTETVENAWDVSANRTQSLYAWVDDRNFLHIAPVYTSVIFLPENCGGLFKGYENVRKILWNDVIDTSNVTDMNRMFAYCYNLTELDVSGFDTGKVTDMGWMFYAADDHPSKLTKLDVSGFDTRNVTNMNSMFYNCPDLTELDVSGFETGKVTDMGWMFYAANDHPSKLTKLDVSGFDTRNVTNMKSMFHNCSNLTELDVSGFETGKVTDMSYMFFAATDHPSKLTKLDVSGFDTRNVTNMYCMFYNCSNLTELDVSGFETGKVTDMGGMFYVADDHPSKLTKLDVSGFDTRNVTNMNSMFCNCSNLTELDVSGFETGKVTDMGYMFFAATDHPSKLTKLDVSGFDTRNVTNMYCMFYNCPDLTELDVSGFETGKVTDMGWMFYAETDHPSKLTKLDVSGFDTRNVTNMHCMFYNCSNLTELDVSGFDTGKVTDMSYMFYNCKNLKKLDISKFDMSHVTKKTDMTTGCGNVIQ